MTLRHLLPHLYLSLGFVRQEDPCREHSTTEVLTAQHHPSNLRSFQPLTPVLIRRSDEPIFIMFMDHGRRLGPPTLTKGVVAILHLSP